MPAIPLKNIPKGILCVGATEISIGAITLLTVVFSVLRHVSAKPLNVVIFVVMSSFVSFSLGVGVILKHYYARKFLLFFAGWIILSKILVFAGIIALNGALETEIPETLKNTVSILYHAAVIGYLLQPRIKAEFIR